MRDAIARHYQSGRWWRVTTRDGLIAESSEAEGPEEVLESDEWIAPAFWDIQLNGRWGDSFSDLGITPGRVAQIVRAQAELGTARMCPTLITADQDAMRHGVRTIAAACDASPDVARRVVGIHLEGPAISAIDGYRGAHPLGAVRDPDWGEFQQLQEESGGRIVLITLAPERSGAIDFISKATAEGVTIALGHTAADGATIREAVAAGARLSTHLGNGIASPIARHPNPIWEQAALDGLDASFIADGHHLDQATLRVLVRAKTPDRTILVSDASPLAGLPPGRYGDWEVDPSGKIVVAGTPYLAGSNQAIEVGLINLLRETDISLEQAIATVTKGPARVLGCGEPTLKAGRGANLIRFRRPLEAGKPSFTLVSTCVDGRWVDRGDALAPVADSPS